MFSPLLNNTHAHCKLAPQQMDLSTLAPRCVCVGGCMLTCVCVCVKVISSAVCRAVDVSMHTSVQTCLTIGVFSLWLKRQIHRWKHSSRHTNRRLYFVNGLHWQARVRHAKKKKTTSHMLLRATVVVRARNMWAYGKTCWHSNTIRNSELRAKLWKTSCICVRVS